MLIVLLIVVSLMLFLLAIPVTLVVHVSTPRDVGGDIEVYWLFDLVRVPVSFSSPKKSSGKKPENRKRNKRLSRKKGDWIKWARQPAVFKRILQYMKDIWQAFYREDLQINLRIGLGDPADTGMLWGVIGPMAGMLKNVHDCAITLEPDFFDIAFDVKGSGKIRFYPLQLIFLTLGLLMSPKIWRTLPLIER